MRLLKIASVKKAILIVGILGSANLFAAESCHETALHGQMKDIGSELRSLSSEVKKGDFSMVSSRVATINGVLEQSKQETPFLFVEMNLAGDELAQKQAKYEEAIESLIVVFQNLDAAAQTGDASQVKSAFAEVGKARKMGHRAFKAEC